MSNTLLPLGSSIGILGGGQLGRMIAMSCIELGYKSFVYCPKGDNPAVEVSSQHIIGDWNNDCLLYTSPSPRDRQKSRIPAWA